MGLVLFAAALRLYRLDFQSFWLDEAHTAFYGAQTTLANTWERLLKPGENGPLYYLLLKPWVHAFGGRELSVRGFSVVASLPAIPLCYVALSRLAGRRPALLATTLFAFAPYVTWYAREAKMYSLLLTLTLASLVLFLEAFARGGWWRWVLYVVAAYAAIYVHFFALFVVASHGVLAVFHHGDTETRRETRSWVRSVGAQLMAPVLSPKVFAAWSAVAIVLGPVGWLQWLAVKRDVAGTAAVGGFTPAQEAGVLLYAFTLNVAPLPLAPVLMGTVLLVLIGTFLRQTLPPGPRPDAGRGWGWDLFPGSIPILFWTPLLAFLVVSLFLRSALFADRYFVFLTPLFYGLVAGGILWLWDRRWWAGAAALVLVVGAWVYGNVYPLVVPIKQDFRGAMARYSAEVRPDDALVPLPRHMAFPAAYYAGSMPNIAYLEPMGDEQVPEADVLLAGRKRVWLVGDVPDDYVRLRTLQEWLEANATLDLMERYPGNIRLWRYTLRES